ncbi:MAG: hypothetical protein GX574_10560 [Lentisphaerae bacterium]|nr:hypothetical protein [Lentisphaerota bacterium]HQL86587.1 winged helix-turn-helix domain-containing protein [Lentisphaeria bacterium]
MQTSVYISGASNPSKMFLVLIKNQIDLNNLGFPGLLLYGKRGASPPYTKNMEHTMSKPGPRVIITETELAKAKQVINRLPYRDDLLVAFAVVLTSQEKLDQADIGEVLGVSQSTVKRMIKDFKKECSASAEEEVNAPTWGGDRRSILTWDEENEVLGQMTPEAIQGHIVTVGDIQSALEAKAGRKMSQQTVYNILRRHKWHKVVPDKVHPKNDPKNLDEFKKNVS